MPLDPSAVGSESEPTTVSWTSKDTLLYAVSLGCGTGELQYATENTKDVQQQVLPTYPVVIPGAGGGRGFGTFNPRETSVISLPCDARPPRSAAYPHLTVDPAVRAVGVQLQHPVRDHLQRGSADCCGFGVSCAS